jgi:uncharacterized protein YsxB (DUF464 family)
MEAYLINMFYISLEFIIYGYPLIIAGTVVCCAVSACCSGCLIKTYKEKTNLEIEKQELKLKIENLEKNIMDYENNEDSLKNLMVDNHILIETELHGNGNVEIEIIDLQANETALIGHNLNDIV